MYGLFGSHSSITLSERWVLHTNNFNLKNVKLYYLFKVIPCGSGRRSTDFHMIKLKLLKSEFSFKVKQSVDHKMGINVSHSEIFQAKIDLKDFGIRQKPLVNKDHFNILIIVIICIIYKLDRS